MVNMTRTHLALSRQEYGCAAMTHLPLIGRVLKCALIGCASVSCYFTTLLRSRMWARIAWCAQLTLPIKIAGTTPLTSSRGIRLRLLSRLSARTVTDERREGTAKNL